MPRKRVKHDINLESEVIIRSLTDLLNKIQNIQAQIETTGISKQVRQSLIQARSLAYQEFGETVAGLAGIPIRQLGRQEAQRLGQQFVPILEEWTDKIKNLGKSADDVKKKFDMLANILVDVRKEHKAYIDKLRESEIKFKAFTAAVETGGSVTGFLGQLRQGNILGATMTAVGIGRGLGALLGEAAIAGGSSLLRFTPFVAAAEAALVSLGAARIHGAWPEAFRNALAVQRARTVMGWGGGGVGTATLGPWVEPEIQRRLIVTPTGQPIVLKSQTLGGLAVKYGVMPEFFATGMMAMAGAGGMGLRPMKEAEARAWSERMGRMFLTFGTSAEEFGTTVGELRRWARMVPEQFDKGFATAAKTGQAAMFPEFLRAWSTTASFVMPRMYGGTGGAIDQIRSVLGELGRYGYRGMLGAQVYQQIGSAVSNMLFDPVRAAVGYGVLGLTQAQMADPYAPQTIQQIIRGVRSPEFRRMFGGSEVLQNIALRMLFPDMSAYALAKIARGQTFSYEKATSEDLAKIANGMLKEPFFHAEQELTRTKLIEIRDALTKGGIETVTILTRIDRFIQMATVGQIVNAADWIDKLKGLSPEQKQYLKDESQRLKEETFGRLKSEKMAELEEARVRAIPQYGIPLTSNINFNITVKDGDKIKIYKGSSPSGVGTVGQYSGSYDIQFTSTTVS